MGMISTAVGDNAGTPCEVVFCPFALVQLLHAYSFVHAWVRACGACVCTRSLYTMCGAKLLRLAPVYSQQYVEVCAFVFVSAFFFAGCFIILWVERRGFEPRSEHTRLYLARIPNHMIHG